MAVIHTGRHPANWKQTSSVAIHNDGQDVYKKLKADRSIRLPRCRGIGFNNVVAEMVSEEAERSTLLSDGHLRRRR